MGTKYPCLKGLVLVIGSCYCALHIMPNLSAGKKSVRSDRRKRLYNLRRTRAIKDFTKQVTELVSAGKMDDAKKALPLAYKAIDKAQKRGVIKKNTASRKKSQLAKLVK